MKIDILKTLLAIGLMLSFNCRADAQQADSLYYLSGQVISEINDQPVSFAHVINIHQRWGAVSDTLGYFDIWVKSGDTLNISALGYHFLDFGIKGFLNDTLIQISLKNRSYQISEAKISYLGTYKEFEYKVVNLELPDDGINPEANKLFKHVETQPVAAPSSSILNPVSMIYSAFSKEANDIRKYIKLKENQHIVDAAREKFNKDAIKKLTGLEGIEAREFMAYCDFSDEYIVSLSEYELYNKIRDRFEQYKKGEKDSLKTE